MGVTPNRVPSEIMTIIEDYQDGLTIRQVAEKNGISYETTRQALIGNVEWRRKYAKNFSNQEKESILNLFDNGSTVKEIAGNFQISAPVISRFLKANDREIIVSCTKYDNFREVPFTNIQKEFIIGTLLGDSHLSRESEKGMCHLLLGHGIEQKEFFLWKIDIMKPFFRTFRTGIDKRGYKYIQGSSIVHLDFEEFSAFYIEKKKTVPFDLIKKYLTPLSLAVWIMDDGNLNEGVNMRIATMSFSFEEHIILQELLKIFELETKIMPFNYKGKHYHQLCLNKENTIKLSNIIRPYVIPTMQYKLIGA